MKKISKILMNSGLFLSIFAVSGVTTYAICYANKDSQNLDNNKIEIPLTPQEKLVNSLTNIQKFDVDARIDLTYLDDMTTGAVTFNGSGDFSNLDTPKLQGTFHADLGKGAVTTDLGYYTDTLYFTFNDSHLYLNTDDIFDFFDTLPSMGINIEIPNELKNLDLNELESSLMNMEPVKCPTGYMFEYVLSQEKEIYLYFKTDDNYSFTGLRTNKFFYQDLYFYLDADLISVEDTRISLVDPSTQEDVVYTNFAPAFNLIHGISNLFQSNQNTINLSLNLNKWNTETVNEEEIKTNNNICAVDLDISYDTEAKDYSISGTATEKENVHHISGALSGETLFASYNDVLKFKVGKSTLSGLLEFIISKIPSETIQDLFNKLSESMNNIDIVETITNFANLNNLIKTIEVSDNQLVVTVDIKAFDETIEADDLVLLFNYDTEAFEGLAINNFNIAGYNGSISITPKTYSPWIYDSESFYELEPGVKLFGYLTEYIKNTQYRVEFSGNVTNSDETIRPVVINGGLQFDIGGDDHESFGYGSVQIADRANYIHNIYVDMKDKNDVLFNYNTDMNGKFKTQTLLDIATLVEDIVNEKDEHFMELFGDLIDTIENSELNQIISTQNYGKLIASNIVSNYYADSTHLSIDVNAAVLGLDDTFTITVTYEEDPVEEYNVLKTLSVTGLNIDAETVEIELSFEEFNESLESTRLDPYNTYLDFSDIKVLLQLGVNTSKVNDWFLGGTIQVTILGIKIDVPVEIKIINDHGKVSAIIVLPDIPVIGGVNGNRTYWSAKERSVVYYYHDSLFYGYRTEQAKKHWYSVKYSTYEATFVADTDYFLNNIMYYICEFGMSFSQEIMNQIDLKMELGPTEEDPIHYEKVLKDFDYNSNPTSGNPYFFLSLNVYELTKNDQLKTLTLTVYHDVANDRLSALGVYFEIDVGISIVLSGTLELKNFGEPIDRTALDSFVAAHANDTINTTFERLF